MAISFRDFQMSDLDSVKRLVTDVWYKKAVERMSKEEADTFLRFYIGHYLDSCTHAEVCEIDGEFAGFLIGRSDNEELKFPGLAHPSVDDVPKGLRRLIDKIGNADQRMLSRCNDRGFDSELKLYMTDGRFRGQGVGSSLMKRFTDHLKEAGSKKMFLFTDDYCNVDYYLKRGFKVEESEGLRFGLRMHKFLILSLEL